MHQNPYQASNYTDANIVSRATVDARVTFIRSTYLHLMLAMFAFAMIEAVILTLFDKQLEAIVPGLFRGYGFFALMIGFMAVSWIADYWARTGVSKTMQYAGLSLYVVAEAVIFVPMLWVANSYYPGAITSAGIVTLTVFGGLTATVFLTKADFSFLRMAISIGSMAAFAFIIMSMMFGFGGLGPIFSILMIVLAAGCILYTTSNVMHHYRTDQSIAAATALFASVALMFWYILQLFMSRD